MTFREAAATVGMSPDGLYHRYKLRTTPNSVDHSANFALTLEEENTIVEVLRKYAERGRPLTREDLIDLVSYIVRRMPLERRTAIRFRNGRPGIKFCRLFEQRHCNELQFRRPQEQEAVRYNATNAEVLVHHFHAIESLVQKYNIDARIMISADETGVSAQKDTRRSRRKRYTGSGHAPFVTGALFANVKRITILACFHANGQCGRPIFVFQGTRLRTRRYRTRHGEQKSDTIADVLPRGALVTARRDVAAVDSANFYQWAKALVDDTSDLTADGRHVLLLYDGFRSHLSISVLELLASHRIIAYALPVHTSGTTQPLDVSLFAPFKAAVRRHIDNLIQSWTTSNPTLDEYVIAQVIAGAYDTALTPENIRAGFRGAGLWPLDEVRLFHQAQPRSFRNLFSICSVEDMVRMLEDRRRAAGAEVLEQVTVLSSGFLDTAYGAVVTSDAALGLLRLQEQDHAKREQEAVEKERMEMAEVSAVKTERRRLRLIFELVQAQRRLELYGEEIRPIRSLKERRAAAAARAQRRQAVE